MNWFKDWARQAQGAGSYNPAGPLPHTHNGPPKFEPPPLRGAAPVSNWAEILNTLDPLGKFILNKRYGNQSHTILAGMADGDLKLTDPDTSVLVLGPPRSIGKTSSMIPALITHRGPLVSISTKPDVFINTAWPRRRQGTVWSFSPDGSASLPGTYELRWSPISDDWNGCLHRSEWMVKASGMTASGGRENNLFWTASAADLLAVVLFYAGNTGKDMRWVINTIGAMRLKEDFLPMVEDLNAHGQTMPASILNGIIYGSDRTRGDIFATARVILRPYMMEGALGSSENPNFDMVRFVYGEPDRKNWLLNDNHFFNDPMVDGETGRDKPRDWERSDYQSGYYDTVYIQISEQNLATCAPLIIGFLGDIQRQVYAQHKHDEIYQPPERRPPVPWAIDELASVPIPNLPAILRDAGSQGLLIYGALQDLSQTAKWGDEGKGLQTLFNNVVVLPGIRNRETLELLSMLVGHYDQEVWTGAYGGDKGGDWRASMHYDRRNRLDPNDLYNGNPYDPTAAFMLYRNTWQWVSLQLYYRTPPWPLIYAREMYLVLSGYPLVFATGLPMPQLVRNGDYSHLAAIDPALPESFYRHCQLYLNGMRAWHTRLSEIHERALRENQQRGLSK